MNMSIENTLQSWLSTDSNFNVPLFLGTIAVFILALIIAVIVLSLKLNSLRKSFNALKGINLRMKIEPHTIRNIFEDVRIKTKKLNKTSEEISEIVERISKVQNQVNDLYKEINNTSDFLSFLADDNEMGHDVVPISKEVEFAEKVISRYIIDPTHYKIVNNLNDNIPIPSMITQSMIENAFKYGDKEDEDFLQIVFSGPDNNGNYGILAKNKIAEKYDDEVYSSGQGIKNLIERLDNYNKTTQGNYKAKAEKTEKNGFFIFRITFHPK